jgi:hypothetical protein
MARLRWLTPVILATWEAKIRRSWFKVSQDKIVENTQHKRGLEE